jgi:hypothetical protein
MKEEKEMTEVPEELPFAAEVWNTLSSIDVSDHQKNKGDITFLPWAMAWQILMEHYPESRFDCSRVDRLENGTAEVWCEVEVRQGAKAHTRHIWLPVMNYKHQAVNDPSAREISDTRMRALVKCIALCGLAIHLYFGEDYPRLERAPVAEKVKKITESQAADLFALSQEVNADHKKFLAYFGIKTIDDMPASRLEEATKILEKKRQKEVKNDKG